MKDDLLTRLRAARDGDCDLLCGEAADEIVRLRARVAEQASVADDWMVKHDAAQAQLAEAIEALQPFATEAEERGLADTRSYSLPFQLLSGYFVRAARIVARYRGKA